MNRLVVILIVLVVVLSAIYFTFGDFFKKPTAEISQKASDFISGEEPQKEFPKVSVLAINLQIPWSLVFLPDKSIIFTERPGRVRIIDAEGKLKNDPILTISEVKHISEGGLLGVTIHPDFKDNDFIYFYYTYGEEGNNTLNRVVRYKFDGSSFKDRVVVVDAIPGAPNHNGGRIKFGPDGFLYITAGDAQEPSLSQDVNSLAGKILRVDGNGNAANGNPFGTRVYSYGHRNPQGIAWDDKGKLFETEHGNSATDEFNMIEPGKNYGWPTIRGDEKQDGLVSPVIHSGTNNTWAPSGLAFLDGSFYFAGLRGNALYQVKVDSGKSTLTEHFKGELGRIRDVVVGPDNNLYIITNNTDGRGRPASDDDKIIVVNPKKL